jgi:hypothetical protein
VIAALTLHQPGAARIAPRAVIVQREIQRGVGAFRTRIGEEQPVQPGRLQFCQALRQLERQRLVELGGRLLDRLDNGTTRMARVYAPQPAMPSRIWRPSAAM